MTRCLPKSENGLIMTKHQILITLDSLRWDVFEAANVPFLKTFPYAKAHAHGTFTLPSHMSMFVGKMPWISGNSLGLQHWRLAANQWSDSADTLYILPGRTLKHGFANLGLPTLGSGGVRWFLPSIATTYALLDGFQKFKFSSPFLDDRTGGIDVQVRWLLDMVNTCRKPCFIFLNAGETHEPYYSKFHGLEASLRNRNAKSCKEAQIASLECCDDWIRKLLEGLSCIAGCEGIICGDHGDCWGDDGFWGHGIVHEKVLDVPLVRLKL